MQRPSYVTIGDLRLQVETKRLGDRTDVVMISFPATEYSGYIRAAQWLDLAKTSGVTHEGSNWKLVGHDHRKT